MENPSAACSSLKEPKEDRDNTKSSSWFLNVIKWIANVFANITAEQLFSSAIGATLGAATVVAALQLNLLHINTTLTGVQALDVKLNTLGSRLQETQRKMEDLPAEIIRAEQVELDEATKGAIKKEFQALGLPEIVAVELRKGLASYGEATKRINESIAKLEEDTGAEFETTRDALEKYIESKVDQLWIDQEKALQGISKTLATLITERHKKEEMVQVRLSQLVKLGQQVIGQEPYNPRDVSDWLNASKYYLLGLKMEVQDGILTDRSAIEVDFLKAVEKYERWQDIKYANRALVILTEVSNLARARRV